MSESTGRRWTNLSTAVQEERLELILAMCKPGSWTEQAACKGTDVPFFSKLLAEERPSGQSQHAYLKPARAMCVECPVKLDCLQHAIRVNEHGIWGGTDHDERGRLRQARTGSHPGWGVCPDCGSEWVIGSKSGPKRDGLTACRCIECNFKWDADLPALRRQIPEVPPSLGATG